MMAIREDDAWDAASDGSVEEEIELDDVGLVATRKMALPDTLNFSMGKKGVNQLSWTVGSDVLLSTSKFDETFGNSSDLAVRGKMTWVRGDTIGRGTMGTVFQAMERDTGRVFAVKEVSLNNEDSSDMKFREQLENELAICQTVHHPRIVSYLNHDYMNGCLYIYMEYMPGGSMAQVLKQFGAFEESLTQVYTRELLEGLEFLHSRDPPVVHRDIKGANVLVGIDTRVKLSDFGCSKRTLETMAHTLRGSIPWMAPEVISNTGYGRRADIWSFGCTVIEMTSGKSPWGKFDNPMAAMMRIGMSKESPPIPADISEPCRDFILQCVKRDKQERPFAAQLMKHGFVQDLLLDED